MNYYCPTDDNYYCMEGNNLLGSMDKFSHSEMPVCNDVKNSSSIHQCHCSLHEDTNNFINENEDCEWNRLECIDQQLEPTIIKSKSNNFSEDLLAGGNEDDKKRFQSTYQTDYILPENPRAVYIKPFACTDHSFTDSYIKNEIDNHFIKVSYEPRAAILPPEHTEYQEAISKLGGQIIREKIHKPKSRDNFMHKFL